MERSNTYMRAKALDAARVVASRHDVAFPTALRMTEALWKEARASILRAVGREDWERLSFADRAEVCRTVVAALLDRSRVEGFLSGSGRFVK